MKIIIEKDGDVLIDRGGWLEYIDNFPKDETIEVIDKRPKKSLCDAIKEIEDKGLGCGNGISQKEIDVLLKGVSKSGLSMSKTFWDKKMSKKDRKNLDEYVKKSPKMKKINIETKYMICKNPKKCGLTDNCAHRKKHKYLGKACKPTDLFNCDGCKEIK